MPKIRFKCQNIIVRCSYLIINLVDFTRFRCELSQLHGLAEGLSDGDARLGGHEGVAVIAQVSAHDRSDWRLRRHSGGTLKGGFSGSFRHISSILAI